MSELIDRQALKDYVSSLSTHPLNEWDTWGVLAAIDKQPTIEAVPVVRCGECKWLFNDSNTFFKPCEVIIPEKDWYCAYGERREG